MKRAIRIISVILSVLMFLAVFTGCRESGGNETTTAPEDSTAAPVETQKTHDDNGYLLDSLPDDLNFGGEKLTFLYWNDAPYADFEAEASDDKILNAINTRNTTVSDRLGVTFEWVGIPGNTKNRESFATTVRGSTETNAGDFDIVSAHSIPEIRREPVTKYLDMGADGLLAPMVKDSADAARLVGFGKYPPVGNRGLSINRAHSRYSPGNLDSYLAAANRRVRIYAQIELLSALEDAENIAVLDGIDGLFVGPTDLSMALGVFNKLDSPVLLDACRRVAEAAAKAGKVSGIITGNMGLISACRGFGMSVFCMGSETRLLSGGLAGIGEKLGALA